MSGIILLIIMINFAWQTNNGFIVADMGGGTLDFSAYRTIALDPLRVEEMATARCIVFQAYKVSTSELN
jgi:N-methylhydantoinase A/oxoprolinase/acetone carboxylase beta subunit